MAKSLVCILAQTRGVTLTWPTFKTNLLEYLDADLALAVGKTTETDEFRKAAKYVSGFPEMQI